MANSADAEYFLSANGGAGLMGGHYMYLETILEETSDDLRSEDSDMESRCSPAGWFATDSEAGSVICIDASEDLGCESDRELACPAKRRKQDYFLTVPSTEEDLSSLSRSSSLVQFETLEKQCQEICSSSPSVYSQFSFDSLEATNRTKTVSPDSLNSPDDVDYYKTLKIDKKCTKDDSLLYNATRLSGSDSSDSDGTLGNSRSCDNLKTWRSFDSLPVNTKSVKEKISAENLSEDSGYSDHMTKSSSASNLKDREGRRGSRGAKEDRRGYHISGNFGISYHDLTIFSTSDTANRLDSLKSPSSSVAMDHYFAKSSSTTFGSSAGVTKTLKLDRSECAYNFRQPSCSEPDLLQACAAAADDSCKVAIDTVTGSASSVPKDLNYLSGEDIQLSPLQESVAAKDWDLADFLSIDAASSVPPEDRILEESEVLPEEDLEDAEMAMTENAGQYRREGSYAEAMANRVDLSDDEHSLINRNKPKLPKHAIVEFDKRVLKAISEQSLQSVLSSTQNLTINERRMEDAFTSTPISERRNIASTPNLAAINQTYPDKTCFDEERRRSAYDIRRKNSGIKSSTSTSGLSDAEEKTLSYAGSTNSKGVHFSPVVSEVNWRDSSISTVTPDRESSVYSLESSSPERRASPPKEIHKPRPRRLAYSQPNLSDNDEVCKREFEDSLKSLRQADYSKSQPDVSRLRRRGSQLVKKDKDGAVVRAYVDSDGVQYRHTHLDQGLLGAAAAQQRFVEKRQSQLAGSGADSVDAMQRCEQIADGGGRRKRSGKIGGFFQRLTGLRFSLRKNETKKKDRYTGGGGGGNAVDGNANGAALLVAPHQRVATKSDYIYIPLKGPPGGGGSDRSATANGGGAPAVAAKPPLPKQPPRVVHVSVKQGSRGQLHDHSPPLSSSTLPEQQQAGARSHHHHRHHHQQQQHRRHRTIDATPGGGHGGGGGSSLANASPIGAMNSSDIAGADSLDGHTCVGGLLETDIDTQVTVVTSANGTKARSLLDLGDGSSGRNRQQLTLQAGEERRDRPHKSMEFLLDKENLKVVEVSLQQISYIFINQYLSYEASYVVVSNSIIQDNRIGNVKVICGPQILRHFVSLVVIPFRQKICSVQDVCSLLETTCVEMNFLLTFRLSQSPLCENAFRNLIEKREEKAAILQSALVAFSSGVVNLMVINFIWQQKHRAATRLLLGMYQNSSRSLDQKLQIVVCTVTILDVAKYLVKIINQ
nr:unnamed protein product [Callosobruchus chinensis]